MSVYRELVSAGQGRTVVYKKGCYTITVEGARFTLDPSYKSVVSERVNTGLFLSCTTRYNLCGYVVDYAPPAYIAALLSELADKYHFYL